MAQYSPQSYWFAQDAGLVAPPCIFTAFPTLDLPYYSEEGYGRFFQKVINNLPDYAASYRR
jgi:hypothetical protein